MDLADFAAFENARRLAALAICPGWGADFLNAGIEGAGGAFQPVERHGADEIGCVREQFGVEEREASDGQHGLRAVDERDAFLGFERERLEAGASKGFGSGQEFAIRVPLRLRR